MTLRYEIADADAMRALGRSVAAGLGAGDVVIVSGSLGAGKTTLTQGIGAGLGVTGPVVSPTFVIARVYRGGRLPLVHVDAYRLGSVAEVDDLDLDAALADSVTVVEWGAGLVEGLAADPVQVAITIADRQHRSEGTGADGPRRVEVTGWGHRSPFVTSSGQVETET